MQNGGAILRQGALRTERVFMGDSILRKTDKIMAEKRISSKEERLFSTTTQTNGNYKNTGI